MRKKPLVNDEYYHIYNRGVDKREVFLDDRDYARFLLSMNLLNDKKDGLMIRWRDYKKCVKNPSLADFLKLNFRKREYLVDVVSYCLMSNHYHFILKQKALNLVWVCVMMVVTLSSHILYGIITRGLL